jgi:hypothetical protein
VKGVSGDVYRTATKHRVSNVSRLVSRVASRIFRKNLSARKDKPAPLVNSLQSDNTYLARIGKDECWELVYKLFDCLITDFGMQNMS